MQIPELLILLTKMTKLRIQSGRSQATPVSQIDKVSIC